MAESEEEPKSLLMRVTEESEKAGLKLNIPETNIIVSEPISSWQRKGKMEAMADFLILGSRTTVDVTAAMKLKDTCFFPKEGQLCPT